MMRRGLCRTWSLTVAVPLAVQAGEPPSVPPDRIAVAASADPSKSHPVDVSDRVIRKAIADSKDPMDDLVPVGRGSFGTADATPQQRIDRRFRDAEIPTCLTGDAYKFEPIGAMIGGNLLFLPFWVHAIATGKCRR